MNNYDFVYDVETYPNIFTLAAEHVSSGITWLFEISEWKDDSHDLIGFLYTLRNMNARMIGFNNLGFDYPIIHTLIKMGKASSKVLFEKSQAIIESQDEDKWVHSVKPSDRFIEQLDLFKIYHFDNRAKSTSLKVLEFNMRSETIEALPFEVGKFLTKEESEVLKKYNQYDVSQTKKFYLQSLDKIQLREELTEKYHRDFMNHNDTKIGKDYFIMKLEEAGVSCYEYGTTGRTPRQTPRSQIALNDVIFPEIEFKIPEFQRVLGWLRQQVITETKGLFKDLKATVGGITFEFGLGGIHASVDSQIIESSGTHVIVDLDVSSYYPNLAIVNKFYPEHLGLTFCEIYQQLYEDRKSYKKKSAENQMLKLALNGVYGDSNQPFSVFYDPAYTMKTTLNGQLLLCVLVEKLLTVSGLELIQANTDGVTAKIPRDNESVLNEQCKKWEMMTGLNLEKNKYSRMFIRDVNNYIAEYEDGKVKRKGAYEYEMDWHQDHSALVIQKVAEKVLLEGKQIRETVLTWPDPLDFLIRVKVPKSSYLVLQDRDDSHHRLPNISRVYAAKTNKYLFKYMPPLKDFNVWRKIGILSGWGVQVCNDLKDIRKSEIDYDYYIQEVEKLCLILS